MSRARDRADGDFAGKELIFDADGDTSITADTDDQIDIRIAGADDFAFKANKFEVQTGSNIDMNGTELILDADGDTSITSDTDDQIDLKVGGIDTVVVTPDVLEVKGSHPDLKLLDSDDNNYGGLFYNDGTLTVGSDHGGQHSSSKARISVDGTARITVDSGGDVDIETGDIFFSTAGKGINLGVTSNTDSNTLDDYEEGTFTLSMNSFAFQTNSTGRYIKIGKFVHFTAFIHALGSQNSNTAALSLPFTVDANTASSNSGYYTIAMAHVSTHAVDTGSIGMSWVSTGGNSTIILHKQDEDGSRTQATNNVFTSEDTMYLSGTFIAA